MEEVRYEKILPQLDTANVADCTEMKFVVPSSSDYFTRCVSLLLLLLLLLLGHNIILFFVCV